MIPDPKMVPDAQGIQCCLGCPLGRPSRPSIHRQQAHSPVKIAKHLYHHAPRHAGAHHHRVHRDRQMQKATPARSC